MSLLFEYDLLGFFDGSNPCPPALITLLDAASLSRNPDHILWLKQDQLLLNVIVGPASTTIVQFISTTTTSRTALTTLKKTYASPSCGQIMTHHQNLANPQQGNQIITEYMQDVKHNIDSLALINVSIDFDELSIHVLNHLGPAYSNIFHALQAWATLVTFEELFEQLLSYEAQMKILVPSALPGSTFTNALVTSSHRWPNNHGGKHHG